MFILVCKNTKLAKVLYEWLAEGWSSIEVPPSPLLDLRNDSNEVRTIRVDSKVVSETDSDAAKSDETAWMRLTLDTVGSLDWPRDDQGRPVYPDGFETLAEKLGHPLHPPGRDIRCIVSVGMLTEGWDCNTVTHIVGLRPFMSQLLCEQVVGRGLRRQDYEVDESGKLTEEVAKILGVPFEMTPFKKVGTGRTVKPKRYHVHALPERGRYEIKFPRVDGYQQRIQNRDSGRLGKRPNDPCRSDEDSRSGEAQGRHPRQQRSPVASWPGDAVRTRPRSLAIRATVAGARVRPRGHSDQGIRSASNVRGPRAGALPSAARGGETIRR